MNKINLSKYYKENESIAQIGYRAFTDRVKSGKYNTLKEALTSPKIKKIKIKEKKQETLKDFYEKNKDIAKISYRTFTNRIKSGLFLDKKTALITPPLNKKRKKEEIKEKFIKKEENTEKIEKLIVGNMLELLEGKALDDKILEIKKKLEKKEKNNYILLFKERDLENKIGKIKGIYYILEEIMPSLFEISDLKGNEVFIVEKKWIKPLKKS